MHSSRLIVIWNEIGAQKSALPSRNNAPSHKSIVAITKLQIGLWIDSSSTLFPDVPCDFFLFPNLKTWVGRKKFSSNEEVIVAVNEYFADFETAYFKRLPNVNYASFLTEIWPEGVRRMDLSRCRVIKWIVAPFHGNLSNLSNDPRIWVNDRRTSI